jgi:hypothetical protein
MSAIKIKEVLTDLTLPVEQKVKTAILFNFGVNNPRPDKLDNTKTMNDFAFDDADYIILTGYFNVIDQSIKPTAAHLMPVTIKGLTAVQDCIDLVTATAKP